MYISIVLLWAGALTLLAAGSAIAWLVEEKRKLKDRLRRLQARYQVLVLKIGIKGYAVENRAEIAAVPATLVLRKEA